MVRDRKARRVQQPSSPSFSPMRDGELAAAFMALATIKTALEHHDESPDLIGSADAIEHEREFRRFLLGIADEGVQRLGRLTTPAAKSTATAEPPPGTETKGERWKREVFTALERIMPTAIWTLCFWDNNTLSGTLSTARSMAEAVELAVMILPRPELQRYVTIHRKERKPPPAVLPT